MEYFMQSLVATWAGGILAVVAIRTADWINSLLQFEAKQGKNMLPRWQHWLIDTASMVLAVGLMFVAMTTGLMGALLLMVGLLVPIEIAMFGGFLIGAGWVASRLIRFLRRGPPGIRAYLAAPTAARY